MIVVEPAPAARAASTNSFSRSERTWPRMMRPIYVQLTTTIATITVDRPGLISPPAQPFPSEQDDAIPSARRRIGNARVTSMTREMTVSVAPR